MTKVYELDELNTLYTESEHVDKEVFAEQRSNILFYLGNQFKKHQSSLSRYIRENTSLPDKTRLKVVKNHYSVICDRYQNAITSHSPGIVFQPRHEAEIQDIKASDIAMGIYEDIKNKNDLDQKVSGFAFDFTVAGECLAKVSFNEMAGKKVAIEQIVNDLGEVEQEVDIYEGKVEIERLETFNVLRQSGVKSIDESEFLIIRKMVQKKKLKRMFGDNKEVLDKITEDNDETFQIFDVNRGGYAESKKDQALVKEIYFRPCADNPEGSYAIYTSEVILEQGSLNGLFPIEYIGQTDMPTTPRSVSSLCRNIRPSQGILNYISSTVAETMAYHKPKVLIQNGTKLSYGGQMAGTHAMKYSGREPVIMKAETGADYLSMYQNSVQEMYQLADIEFVQEEKTANVDPNLLIMRSMREKLKFSNKTDRFERFLKKIALKAIDTARIYYTEDNYVSAVDKKDHINIIEFRNIKDLQYSVEVKAMTEDMNTMLGQNISIMNAIQYAQALDQDQQIALLSSMPFLKDTKAVQDIIRPQKKVDDVFAAIERGDEFIANAVLKYDNHELFIRRISERMTDSSFGFLPPQVQYLYEQRLLAHETVKAQNAQEIQRAQSGMIPESGALVTINGIKKPGEDGKAEVLRLPAASVLWLEQKLRDQGSVTEELPAAIQNEGAVADIASQLESTQQDNFALPPNQVDIAGGIV